jgi:3-hydroxyisobutyrate dehydrogenase-like beta-hydroxyacid dehydrogenase
MLHSSDHGASRDPKSAAPICGFIGLGSQGAPIASRIIDAGYPVVLWARRPQTLKRFRGTSATIVASIAELGAKADHVGVCVSDDAAVRAVCDELIPAMRPESRIAIHSTTHPETCREIARQATRHDLLFIEAPVSGGAPAAAAGKLTVMMGGSLDAVAAVQPIFATFANLIVHLGDVGSGQIAKLINNTLMAANLGLAHSAVSVGCELGIESGALHELLNASSARSYALEVYARQSSLASFANRATLLDKVRLLSEVIGDKAAAFAVLRHAAAPLLLKEGSSFEI